MLKFTSNSDFNFDVESVSIITDNRQLTKRASAKELLNFKKTAGQTDLHVIALGAYEGTGYNRNGDAFMEKDCKSNHNYFVKAGRAIHRHHKNKPSDPKFGIIKASAYNEPMKRIELIIGLDNDKCCDILDEQEKKGHTNWSMASKQAYDICSWCDHKAKTDADRCEHIPAKLGELRDDGEMCGMINPEPKWFELSYVSRPADRIGMSLKLASDNNHRMQTLDYINRYGNIYVPDDLVTISKKASDKRSLLHKLSEMEKHVDAVSKGSLSSSKDKYLNMASKVEHDNIPPEVMSELRKHDPSKLLKMLAENGIIFSPEDFSKYVFDNKVGKKQVDGMKSHLPNSFSKMEDEGCDEAVNNESYEPSCSDIIPPEIKKLISGLIDNHSLSGDKMHGRIMRITIIKGMGPKKEECKEQSKEAFDQELAKQYIAYKLAALNYLNEHNNLDEDIMWNAIIQNR